MSFDMRTAKVNEVQRGWISYFKGPNIYVKFRDLEGTQSLVLTTFLHIHITPGKEVLTKT